MKIIKTICNWECHKKTFFKVLFDAVISLIPITAAVVMLLFARWQGWNFFWANGEFYIYSVVFITSALHILISLGVKNSNLTSFMTIIIILCLAISLCLYGSLIYNKIIQDGITPQANVLKMSSLVLLVLSLASLYIMTYWKFYISIIIDKNSDREEVEDIKDQIH